MNTYLVRLIVRVGMAGYQPLLVPEHRLLPPQHKKTWTTHLRTESAKSAPRHFVACMSSVTCESYMYLTALCRLGMISDISRLLIRSMDTTPPYRRRTQIVVLYQGRLAL